MEILSKTINVQLENETRDKKKEITLDELDYNFSHCKVNDYLDKEFKETAKLKECTKCKESQFVNNDELRKHYKSEWHVYNVKLLSSVKK